MASAFSKWGCSQGAEQIGTNRGSSVTDPAPETAAGLPPAAHLHWKVFSAKVGAPGGRTNAFPTWQGQERASLQPNLSFPARPP